MARKTNWRSMQLSGSFGAKDNQAPMARPSEVLSKYMTMGSWKASLSDQGKCTKWKLKGQTR